MERLRKTMSIEDNRQKGMAIFILNFHQDADLIDAFDAYNAARGSR